MKGNIIYCSDEEPSYRKIARVLIGGGDWAFKSRLLQESLPSLNLDEPQYTVENVSFELGDLKLTPAELPPIFPVRAAAFVEATAKVCYASKLGFVFASREAQEDSGDSDDEAPMDREVRSPFTSDESVCINALLEKYWRLFSHTQDKYFHNAVGKYFLDSYFQLCTWVLKRDLQLYLSTNPNGEY